MRACRVVRLDLIVPDGRQDRAAHRHPCHELIVPLADRYQLRHAGGLSVAVPGQLVVIPAGTEHHPAYQRRTAVSFYCFAWDGAAPGATIEVRPDVQGRLLMLLQWMRELYVPGATSRPPQLEALAEAAVLELIAPARPRRVADRIERLQTYIAQHLAQPLSMRVLAQVAGLSVRQTHTRFVQRYGSSPMAHVRRQRLALAMTLAASGRRTLAEIARQVGIAQPSHLSRLLSRAGHPLRRLRS